MRLYFQNTQRLSVWQCTLTYHRFAQVANKDCQDDRCRFHSQVFFSVILLVLNGDCRLYTQNWSQIAYHSRPWQKYQFPCLGCGLTQPIKIYYKGSNAVIYHNSLIPTSQNNYYGISCGVQQHNKEIFIVYQHQFN